MLLVHPVQALIQFLPALLGIVVVGQTNDSTPWWFEPLFVALAMAAGVSRWFTTSYRIDDETVQVRSGLFQRTTVRANLDRVRTVDVTASPMHRLLRLSRVKIGTGADTPLELNGLAAEHARRLRAELLHRRHLSGSDAGADPPAPKGLGVGPPSTRSSDAASVASSAEWTDAAGAGHDGSDQSAGRQDAPGMAASRQQPAWATPDDEEVLGHFRIRWVLLAPLTTSGLLVAAALWGFLGQYTARLIEQTANSELRVRIEEHVANVAIWFVVVEVVVVASVMLALLSIGSYLLSYVGYRLTRHPGGTLQVVRGLLTTRATSLEEARIRGVVFSEPLLLRLAGGAKATALTTGFNRGEQAVGSANNLLTPPAPRVEVIPVVTAVLRASQPCLGQLNPHGRAARRRRYTRALLAGLIVTLPSAGAVLAFDLPRWLLAPCLLPVLTAPLWAALRYQALGHARTDGYLVARSGIFPRERSMLMEPGIIGWSMTSSFFQRRVGLVTLAAMTAAGSGAVRIPDVPADTATDLVRAINPSLITPFLTDR